MPGQRSPVPPGADVRLLDQVLCLSQIADNGISEPQEAHRGAPVELVETLRIPHVARYPRLQVSIAL